MQDVAVAVRGPVDQSQPLPGAAGDGAFRALIQLDVAVFHHVAECSGDLPPLIPPLQYLVLQLPPVVAVARLAFPLVALPAVVGVAIIAGDR